MDYSIKTYYLDYMPSSYLAGLFILYLIDY